MSSNVIQKIAIVGGSGGVGTYILNALAATNRFQITAISRTDSKSTFPASVNVVRGEYTDEDFLVKSFSNQDALIIALGFASGHDTEPALIRAAAKAGIPWILPTEYGSDGDNPKWVEANPGTTKGKAAVRALIEDLGVSSWIAISNNPFYGAMLAAGFFQIDIKSRRATLYDQGITKLSTSTYTTIGATIARLLSLPIKSQTPGELQLSQYRNKFAYVSSFRVTQREVLDAVQRATATTDGDWTIDYAPAAESLSAAQEKVKQGDRSAVLDCVRISHFVEGLGGDPVPTKGNDAERLGVPKEDLDEETAKAVAGLK